MGPSPRCRVNHCRGCRRWESEQVLTDREMCPDRRPPDAPRRVRFGSDPRSVLAALTFVLGVFWPALAPAQVVRKDFYVTNGPVYATVLVGNTLYLGGSFSQLGPSTGGGIPVDTATAAVVTGFPRVSANGVPSAVNAVVSDGAGGWYIGGSFTTVGDVPRANLAHVLANNTVSDWNPGTDLPGYCLARIGSGVYLGGSLFPTRRSLLSHWRHPDRLPGRGRCDERGGQHFLGDAAE